MKTDGWWPASWQLHPPPRTQRQAQKTKSIVYCATIVGFAAEIDLGLKDGFMLLMNEGGPS